MDNFRNSFQTNFVRYKLLIKLCVNLTIKQVKKRSKIRCPQVS